MQVIDKLKSVGKGLYKKQYRNDPKFSDGYVWANKADPDRLSDQGLHSLPFRLHRLDSLLYGRAT